MLDDDDKVKEQWPQVMDLFSNEIVKAANWKDATIVLKLEEMVNLFHKAYPDVECSLTDMQLALHAMNIPRERNEHNDEFYYLAKWR